MTLGHIHNILVPVSNNINNKLYIVSLDQNVQHHQHVSNAQHHQHVQFINEEEEEDEEEVDEVFEEDPDYNPNDEFDEGYRTSSVTSGRCRLDTGKLMLQILNANY